MTEPVATEIASDLVTGTEIDFRPKTFEHGSYRFNRLLPVQGPLTQSLSTTNVSVTTMELPAKVFNLSKSVLRFQMQVPCQSATTNVWIHADGIPVIDRLSLFTRSGVYIADLTNFGTFMKVTNKWTQSKQELVLNDKGSMSAWAAVNVNAPGNSNGTATNGFQSCDCACLNLPQTVVNEKALQANTSGAAINPDTGTVIPTFSGILAPGNAGLITSDDVMLQSGINRIIQQQNYLQEGNQMPQAVDATGSIDITEQRYLFNVGRADLQQGVANNISTLNYVIKFGQIPHSIFSVNKDLYFGETLILQINWAPLNRVGFQGSCFDVRAENRGANSPDIATELHPASTYLGYTRPSTGVAVAANAAAAILNATTAFSPNVVAQMNNITLYLAVETNRLLIETIVRQMSTSGLRLLIPYVVSGKYTSTAGNTQNVQQRINRAWGRTLLRIYHSVFNASETEINAYNNYNVAGAGTVQSFYTTLDNDRIQEVNLDCRYQDDYLFLKEMFEGTAYQSAPHYQSNWSWVDDWTGRSPSKYKELDIGECGLTLATERLWQIYMTMAAAASYNHYTFYVCQKMLTITPTQIVVV